MLRTKARLKCENWRKNVSRVEFAKRKWTFFSFFFCSALGRTRPFVLFLIMKKKKKKVSALAYFCRNHYRAYGSRVTFSPSSLAAPSFRCSFIADTFVHPFSFRSRLVLLQRFNCLIKDFSMECKHSVTEYCTEKSQLLRRYLAGIWF